MKKSISAKVNDWYRDGFEQVYHSTLMDWVYRRVYRFMDRPHQGAGLPEVLEVGAGASNFRLLAQPSFSKYTELDLREEFGGKAGNVHFCVGNAEVLKQFDASSFDRVIATCLLAHLERPEEALREWHRVVRPGGSLTIYVPSEGSVLLQVARNLVTWPLARAQGFDARRVAALQHRYSYFFLEALIREVFEDDKVTRRTFPFRFWEYHLALFTIFEVTKVK